MCLLSLQLVACDESTPGEGVACTSASDCREGLLCSSAKTCQDGDAGDRCIGNSDCAATDGANKPLACVSQSCSVVECRSDLDCDYDDVCSASNFCIAQQCTGLATSCSSLVGASCGTVSGCRLEGDCSGIGTSCLYFSSSYSCNAQPGCYWSSSGGGNCYGSVQSCSLQSSSYLCTDIQGCSWTQQCTGVAESCSSFSPGTCDLQPGCYVSP